MESESLTLRHPQREQAMPLDQLNWDEGIAHGNDQAIGDTTTFTFNSFQLHTQTQENGLHKVLLVEGSQNAQNDPGYLRCTFAQYIALHPDGLQKIMPLEDYWTQDQDIIVRPIITTNTLV